LMNLNPMTGTISAFRSATLGLPVDWQALSISVLLAMLLLSAGLAVFAHTEKTFADVI
ncbi:MAG: ABC transporter permease, partial [Phycisphaerales bacterium]|nr:ABC transporter permease [Phycisphaerales bacterium]